MRRREFLAQTGALLAGASRQPPAASRQRSAMLVLCEQFQHDAGSFAGGPAATPNLEKLAGEAVHFRSACTTTGLCSPARAALFTGRLGHRTGVDDNCNVWHSRLTGLDPKQTTLIEWARRKNYFTGYYGKWHLGKDGPIARGANRYPKAGFDRNARPGKVSQKPDFSVTRKYYEKGAAFAEKPGFYATAAGAYEQNEAAALARQGREFLREAAGQPFFLTVSFNAVHPPYRVPRPYSGMYDPAGVRLPSNLRDTFRGKPAYQNDVMWPFHDTGHLSEGDWRRSVAFYRGFVSMLDRAVGELLDGLRENGLWDSTMVIFVADHGDMSGAHNRFDKGPYCYEEIMRVPLLVRVPGARAREVRRQVSSMDLNRTLAEWMGLEPDIPNADSRSLFPLIERGDLAWSSPDEAFYRYEWYNGLWFGIRAIRTPRHKYCFNPCGVDELYDLAADPGEISNLSGRAETRAVERDLQARLLAHLQESGDSLLHSKLKAYMDSA